MKKTVNLTIRVEPKLREDAEEAAAYFDTDLSKFIRRELKHLVREYKRQYELQKVKELRELENPVPVVEMVDGQPRLTLATKAKAKRVQEGLADVRRLVMLDRTRQLAEQEYEDDES